MLPLLMLFLVQEEIHSCNSVQAGQSILLARFIGRPSPCIDCQSPPEMLPETRIQYEVLEQFSGPSIPKGRIQVLYFGPRTEAPLQLLAIDGEHRRVLWIQEVFDPDQHPTIIHLRHQTTGSIQGRAATENTMLAGVRMTLTKNGKAMVEVSDADGQVAFRDLEPGRYELTAEKDLYTRMEEVVVVSAGSCPTVFVYLKPVNELRGVLVDERGIPISDVQMQLFREAASPESEPEDWPRGAVVTDADGAFSFQNSAAGSYVLAVNGMHAKPRFLPDTADRKNGHRFELQPGSDPVAVRFVLKGLGRRYEIDVRGQDPSGGELAFRFSLFPAEAYGGLNREQNAREFLIFPRVQTLTLFEGLSYVIEPGVVLGVPAPCLRSQPVELPVGAKSNLTLRFQKVPCTHPDATIVNSGPLL